ncbi:MAG: hypothetical protein A3F82_09890 [Deltaproteobacteria bacterium RIFCSPLOWO2_12_FULL_44_12]|nr:MAG: hypothetical protein A2712_04990 [Deltaproteobacteria bacterium RIFCSPHIGHO2_01_FULL_43_49]OGQ15924.1 MAG: hypothetical protein A3D22_07650 [Deltaproteobacteria bacterium RIFCSPHIGHO2_02_FULL_44_53]OGQ28886.1 MAG: hypothetical protein A3D98_06020 [Deltaproteobacteria bacterium RIFCSPHIGHO2_12_FULL_44_21]OGQ30978.1 MAG: hypothetical protein A2979_02040 [Deltaproteobacteria bacterium RIFCSPLOWO2_01_FULL_45_74]OGQ43484.1 MAG: hypothetical protein A3I70_00195 [Deltaproteobacteria bacterium 
MRTLLLVDYLVIAAYILLCLFIGFYFTKRAGKSSNHFFVGNRSMPWWLIGTSMAATNFSADTPLAITQYIFEEGIAGVWFFWATAIQATAATFLFAQLWRRSEMITDNQLVEFRYGGKSAAFLRLFKGFYFGIFMNCIMMGWIFKGLIKIMTGVTNLDTTQVVIIFTAITLAYTVASGIYAALWADFVQYYIAVFGCTVLAFYAVAEAGGVENILTQLNILYGSGSGITQLYPRYPQAEQWMPMSVFMTYIGMKWWAHKFSDGGGKHIQRMLSAKTERDSVMACFFYSFMNFIIQIWPWIMTALAALVIFGRDLKDPEMAYPMMIARVMPNGLLGLILIAAIAAFMSTMSTHINLGSSYMVNDIYRRFMVKNASDKHYVLAARLATIISISLGILVAVNLKSIGNTWKLAIEFASGAGLVWILRWFWWRINAWTEIAAMTTSALVTFWIELWQKTSIFTGKKWLFSEKLWVIVGISTIVWLAITYITKPTDLGKLQKFVERIRPSKFGWQPVYKNLNVIPDFKLSGAAINFVIGLLFLCMLNFGIGNVLLLNTNEGIIQLGVAGVSFIFLLWRINRKKGVQQKEALTEYATS